MDGSVELDVGGNRGSGGSPGRARQVVRNTASGLDAWMQEVGQAPPVIANAASFVVKKTWTTRGAFFVGAMVFVCGLPVAGGILWRFTGGLLTAADSRPLHRNASVETQLGRGIGRPAVLAVGGFSKGVGEALKEYQPIDAYYESGESPTRVSTVSRRRPEGLEP
jgi:hypothetical protein